MKTTIIPALLGAVAFAVPAQAQDHSGHDMGTMQPAPAPAPTPTAQSEQTMPPMEGMDHMTMDHSGDDTSSHAMQGHDMAAMTEADPDKPREGSGTARLPAREAPDPMLHAMAGDWMLMAHGNASLNYTKHTGPRGDDKLYATSMLMLMAERQADWGRFQARTMLSLEPAMDARGYPNLFATGETANGLPLVDRQHPHDLFMELAARLDINAGPGSLFLYGGPVGEPAFGPSAFMHRGSARNNPEPPITHHWFDSTHITYGVVTAGYATDLFQIEGSAFRGQEPDEHRWNIETPRLDSWSVRGTLTPTPNWALQASYGEIKQPEATHPGENENRFTASAHYAGRAVSAMLAFSAKKRVPGDTLTAWLGEVNWDIDTANSLFGRIENVKNDELFPDHLDPRHDTPFRVTKFQAGYARHIPLGPVGLTLGGSVNAYAKPAVLDAVYGDNPMGYTLFAKLTLGN
ncbi:MAG: hypothetical protein JSR28_08130 [Proteobacteria bacterium]|nr:hypothetical protein [Pseudomonadota bacterium]